MLYNNDEIETFIIIIFIINTIIIIPSLCAICCYLLRDYSTIFASLKNFVFFHGKINLKFSIFLILVKQVFYFYFVWKIWLTQLPEVDPAENWLTRYLHFQEPESKNSAILLKSNPSAIAGNSMK